MPPDLAAAIADFEARADATAGTESTIGWRHAAMIARLFKCARHTLQQLRHHAAFWKESSPDKASAYREAMAVVAHHTGIDLLHLSYTPAHPEPTLELALF